MKKIVLAAYDPDAVYMERFIKYTSKKPELPFDILGFTDLNILESHIKSDEIDALLLSRSESTFFILCRIDRAFCPTKKLVTDSATFEKLKRPSTSLTISDTGEQQCEDKQADDVVKVDKFRSMEVILSEVRQFIDRQFGTEMSAPSGTECKIIGIYDPAGKCGGHEAAKIIAAERHEGKILYINLERFQSCENGPEECSGSLSDVLYFYKTDRTRMAEALAKAKWEFVGMDAVSAPENMMDLRSIEEDEWEEFLKEVGKCGSYRMIIFDMGEAFADIEKMFGMCSRIYVPVRENMSQGQKNAHIRFRRMAELKDIGTDRQKISEIRIGMYGTA